MGTGLNFLLCSMEFVSSHSVGQERLWIPAADVLWITLEWQPQVSHSYGKLSEAMCEEVKWLYEWLRMSF